MGGDSGGGGGGAGGSDMVRVGYVSDIEGDYAKWNEYVEMSWVLERERHSGGDHGDGAAAAAAAAGADGAAGAAGELKLKAGCHLVFGGDAVDKGE